MAKRRGGGEGMNGHDGLSAHGNGNARARTRHKRPRVAAEDDRPRGYQPQRMRQLWSDIDQARDKLGLGPDVPTDAGNVGAVVLAAACAAAACAAALVRQVPLVGWLCALLPGVEPDAGAPRER